ncbi:MAG: HAD family hydrolase [Sandaracinaceae bacterium]
MVELPSASELDALFLDAGNTVVFLDHGAIAEVAAGEGHRVEPERLREVEGIAKRRYEALLAEGGAHEEGYVLYLTTLLTEAGLGGSSARTLMGPIQAETERLNLWRRVPDDLGPALDRAQAAGLRLAIISNSEGRLPQLFRAVGLAERFEAVIDSHDLGVRKPDPRIFEAALARLGVAAERSLYAGDIPSVDVEGARGAGMHGVLIDTLGFYPDYDDAPRFGSVAALVAALARGPGPG